MAGSGGIVGVRRGPYNRRQHLWERAYGDPAGPLRVRRRRLPGAQGAAAHARREGVAELHRQGVRARHARDRGPPGARRRSAPGDRVALFVENRPEWHIAGLRLPPARRRLGAALRDAARAARCATSSPTRGRSCWWSRARSAPAPPSRPSPACPACGSLGVDRGPRRGPRVRSATCRCRRTRQLARAAAALGRRSREPDLHLRHHRRAQGRDALAPQLHLAGEHRRGRSTRSPSATSACRSCRSRTSSSARWTTSSSTAASQINYVESIERVPTQLTEIRPTIMVSVPRLYERSYIKIISKVQQEGGAKRRLFEWALRVGREVRGAEWRGERASAFARGQFAVARSRVFSKVLERLGGRLRFTHLGRRPARPRGRGVLRHRRPADPAGVRAHRVVAGDRGQPPRRQPPRLGRAGVPRRRGAHRARRRDPRARPQHHARVLGQARGDRGGDRRRRLAAHRRRRLPRLRRVPVHHRSQEGHHRHLGRQERRPAADRGAARRHPVHRPGRADRGQVPVPDGARRAQLREPARRTSRARGSRGSTARRWRSTPRPQALVGSRGQAGQRRARHARAHPPLHGPASGSSRSRRAS